MGPQAHKLHHRRTTVKRLRRNYEDLPKFSGLRVFATTDQGLCLGTANPFYGTQIWIQRKAD